MKNLLLITFCCAAISAAAQSGITWGMAGMDIANNTHDNMQPRIALDGSGNPLVIWGRMSDESVLFSRWNGTAFTAPVKLNPSWLTVATASWMGPDIASKGDTVYVVVRQTPESADTSKHIYIMRSTNGGVTFSTPIQVDNIGDSVSRFPAVTVDDNGNPIVAFMKFNSAFGDSRWVVAKSNDLGNTFSTDTKASDYNGAGDEVCDCCPGTILSSGNVCAMLYRDNASNIRDMWTGISNNGGMSFPTGFAVDTNDWMIMSCPSSGPDGVIIGDNLYSVYMSGGSGGYRVYMSKTSISTGSILSFAQLTATIPGLTQQNYPRIAKNGNAVAITWKQNVSGASQLPMLFTNDINNGFPATYDTVDLANETNADVAVSNGNVYVVWQDDNAGTVKYRVGTYTPAPQVGSVHVMITPAAAVTAGVTWDIDGGAPQQSGTTVTNISAGSHTINYNTVSGWIAPASQSVNVIANQLNSINSTFTAAPTGLAEIEREAFTIFPNPANEYLNLYSKDNSLFSFNVFNAIGEKVYSGESSSGFQVPVASWANGIYFIQLKSGNSFHTQKFFKH